MQKDTYEKLINDLEETIAILREQEKNEYIAACRYAIALIQEKFYEE